MAHHAYAPHLLPPCRPALTTSSGRTSLVVVDPVWDVAFGGAGAVGWRLCTVGKRVTTWLPQSLLRLILVAAVAAHIGEGLYAYRLAGRLGLQRSQLGWECRPWCSVFRRCACCCGEPARALGRLLS